MLVLKYVNCFKIKLQGILSHGSCNETENNTCVMKMNQAQMINPHVQDVVFKNFNQK